MMWHRIPALRNRPTLQKVISNTGWLFADRILRMGVGLFVGVWIARYLGPDQYGLWSYALAFTALFGAFGSLGLDNIVVRDIVKYPEEVDTLLGTAFGLKLMGGLVTLIIVLGTITLIRPQQPLLFWLVCLSASGFVFQSFNVIDFYFQAKIQSKFSVYAMNLAFLIITLVKVALLIFHAPLIAFGMAGLAEVILSTIMRIILYRFNHLSIKHWRFTTQIATGLLKNSWPLMLSSMAIMVYMRIDQIMIGQMLGDKDLGLFSAAVRISEVWYFVPIAIVSSVFPTIVMNEAKNEVLRYQRLQKLFNLMASLGVCVAVVMTVASGQIVHILFGENYAASASVLSIQTWAGVFVCLGVASSSWLTAENLQKYSFYRTLIGAVVNVSLNFVLIPNYGIKGAAVATVISYGVSVFSIGTFTEGKTLARMMFLSFIPLRWGKA
ncbi:MAG: flippase [Desulfomonilaceae bacterium]